jgi:hypothetical protein
MQNAHQTPLYFKTHLPLITILHKLYILPILANNAQHSHPLLVDGDQHEDAGIVADQNLVHVFIIHIPALAAPEAHGGGGDHGRHGPRTRRLWQSVSNELTS